MPPPPVDVESDESEEGGGVPQWMVTYADMVTLLMTFFIVLLSFANMDVTKFQDMMGSIREALGVNSDDPGFFVPRIVPKPKLVLDADLEEAYAEMGASLEEQLEDYGLTDAVEVSTSGTGVSMRLEGSLIYEPASATMNPRARTVLKRLASMMKDVYLDNMMLMVEGHTDSRHISSDQFPSNWELSSARAAGALRALTEFGVPGKQVVAMGFGATRPLASNDTEAGRARNRRVEFRMVVTPDEAEVISRSAPPPPPPESAPESVPESGGAGAGE